MTHEPPPLANLWVDGREPPQHSGPLAGDVAAEVAIIGGGYTGLSAALHLAEAGREVVVLESETVGFGASGRNGGQVIPGLKLTPDELKERFGPDAGAELAKAAGEAAELVFELIQRLGISCAADRRGWVQPAHNNAAVPRLRGRFEKLRDMGADVAWLDAEDVARALGTHAYVAGWIDRGAGSVQPALFAEGLAHGAADAGALILDRTRATSTNHQNGRWLVTTPEGRVTADWLLIATNGYSDRIWPKLRHGTLAVESAQVATEVLPSDIAAQILPGCAAASDSRRLLLYFRKSPDGRLLIGGRGAFFGTTSPARYAGLIAAAEAVFPQLADRKWTHAWSGKVALTPDGLPRASWLGERAIAAFGYNGRGVAQATLFGKSLAALIVGAPCAIPVRPFSPLPFPIFHRAAGASLATIYRLLDRFN